ncbi:MAG: ABC transporter permease, partial [Gemmatimonadota bacterium]
MRLFEELLYRLRALLRRADLESELDEELRFHVERETEKLVREEGLEPAEARRRALVAFGGVEQAKEGAREARGVGLVDVLARDVRFALRGMRKSPIFAGTLVLVLGLAIGADSAMFAVADALLLRPLPYGEPGELVEVWRASEEGYTGPIHRLDAARRWSEEAEFLDGALLNVRRSVLYLGGAEPQTVPVQAVGPNFEEVLRVRPALGRGFTAGDAEPGSPPTTILSHDFWRTAFGADTAVLGRTIELDGRPHRVIGVMPEGFKFPTYAHTDAWIPLYADDTVLGDAVGFGAYLVGRLAGQGIEAAQARADALATALEERASSGYGWTVRLEPFRDANGPNDDARQAMALLGAAVALILLIAGANAVHLLLVRGWARGRELAVRRAL